MPFCSVVPYYTVPTYFGARNVVLYISVCSARGMNAVLGGSGNERADPIRYINSLKTRNHGLSQGAVVPLVFTVFAYT